MRHETKEDRLNEALILGEFMCNVMNHEHDDPQWEAIKVPDEEGTLCCPDYRLVNRDGKVGGYAEIKRRHMTRQTQINLGGTIIDLQKYNMLRELTPRFRVCLVVALDDCHGYHVLNVDEVSEAFQITRKRNGVDEEHTVVRFNHEDFRIHHDIGLPK